MLERWIFDRSGHPITMHAHHPLDFLRTVGGVPIKARRRHASREQRTRFPPVRSALRSVARSSRAPDAGESSQPPSGCRHRASGPKARLSRSRISSSRGDIVGTVRRTAVLVPGISMSLMSSATWNWRCQRRKSISVQLTWNLPGSRPMSASLSGYKS